MPENGRVIVGCTHGEEDPDRVVVSYLTAGAALDQGKDVVMWFRSRRAQHEDRDGSERRRYRHPCNWQRDPSWQPRDLAGVELGRRRAPRAYPSRGHGSWTSAPPSTAQTAPVT